MIFFLLVLAGFLTVLFYRFSYPAVKIRRRIKALFHDYFKKRTLSPDLPESLIWKDVAACYFKARGRGEQEVARGARVLEESCEDFMARHDVLRIEKEKAKELARRILLYEAGTLKPEGYAGAEKVYADVESAAREFFKK